MDEQAGKNGSAKDATWDLFIPGPDGKIPVHPTTGQKIAAGHLWKAKSKAGKNYMEGYVYTDEAHKIRIKLFAFHAFTPKKSPGLKPESPNG